MNFVKFRQVVISLAAAAAMGCVLIAAPAGASFFQKRFMICEDRGRDILCDPYVVRKNDYVTKLFKQRGEIAYADFPKFLGIFKRLNPEIEDIDLIYPNQKILIPLKILAPGTIEGQSTGTVTIPVINITNLPDSMLQSSSLYEVKAGDTVSELILKKFGNLSQKELEKALQLVKRMNPDLEDLDLISVGEKIRLPNSAIRHVPRYKAVFDASDRIAAKETAQAQMPEAAPPEPAPTAADAEPAPKPEPIPESEPVPAPEPLAVTALPETKTPETKTPEKAQETTGKKPESKKKQGKAATPQKPVQSPSVYRKAARVLNARLLDKGDFFFPRKGLSDLKLELDRTPVMELPGGQRLLFDPRGRLEKEAGAAVKRFWEDLSIVRLTPKPNLRDLFQKICPIIDQNGCENKLTFSDNGISVTVRGEYIYDRPAGSGKVCVTFIREAGERTPASIYRYLARHGVVLGEWIDRPDSFANAHQAMKDGSRTDNPATIEAAGPSGLVRGLASRLGYNYQEDIEISFPYAGFQVEAWTHMLSLGPNREVLIDFGDLQGDAIKSIEKTGFQVIQLSGGNDYYDMARQLLSELPVEQVEAPIFWTAKRRRIHNISIQIPATVVFAADESGNERKILITGVEVPTGIRYFLDGKGFEVVQIPGP